MHYVPFKTLRKTKPHLNASGIGEREGGGGGGFFAELTYNKEIQRTDSRKDFRRKQNEETNCSLYLFVFYFISVVNLFSLPRESFHRTLVMLSFVCYIVFFEISGLIKDKIVVYNA